MNTIIISNRLYLREMEKNDLDSLTPIFTDKDTMMFYPKIFSIEEIQNWIERNIIRYKEHGYGLWAVVLKDSHICIGDCGITLQEIEKEQLPEIGYHINKKFQNCGYASEASRACIEYAFTTLTMNRVYSYMSRDNLSSIRVAEKNGMVFLRNFSKMVMEKEVIESLYCLEKENWI